jgi:hypothetical protein
LGLFLGREDVTTILCCSFQDRHFENWVENLSRDFVLKYEIYIASILLRESNNFATVLSIEKYSNVESVLST